MGVGTWSRSLYWRIALGLFGVLTLMLVAEGALFLWMAGRIAGSMPARDPRRLAQLVASDVGTALASQPDLDLQAYVREQYGQVFQTLFVVLSDGRAAANHDDAPPLLMEMERRVVERRPARVPPRERLLEGRGGRGQGGLGARGRGQRAPIVVGSTAVGRVVVLSDRPPFRRILRELGPMMALVAGGVLITGTAVIALVVFGPVRRRLKAVEAATTRLGGGDLAARVPDQGGDEVAALARAFNRMADDLATRAQALSVSDKARRQLLADVSHELMTPLTAMRGYVETLAMAELQLDPATRERYLGIVTQETHRLEHIVGDLLDLARLEGGGTTMRRDRVPVSALFDRVATRHERDLREHEVTMTRDIEPGAEHVTGDADRLEQVLQNLAANALRYTPAGGRIALHARRVGDGIRLVVRDNGPGIAPDHLPLIFDRFYKGDAARKAAGGSGLGLSIVRAIVERHGGTITVRNDGGAVFEMTLPDVSAQ